MSEKIGRRWLTTREVAERVGVGIDCVVGWLNQGKLRGRRRVTHWQVDADDVERLVQERSNQ